MSQSIKKALSACALVITLLSSVATTVAQTCSTPSFRQPPVYAAGSDIRGMASADFDGDGDQRQLEFPLPLPHPGMLPNYGAPHFADS